VQVQHRARAANTSSSGIRSGGRSASGCRLARTGPRQAQDLGLGIGLRIADAHVHQEAVELRLGQREGALLLDRVLRGHHQEQRGSG
jgi:hypothetical protein